MFVDPANLDAISRYRSGVGHAYSDDYEPNNRSLKNYFEPLPAYLDTNTSLPVYAPATGTITSVTAAGQVLSTGEHRGTQIELVPDGYPQFDIVLFHVNAAPGLKAGVHVTAGDPLGFADIRESVDFDWSVFALWNATPLYATLDPTKPLTAPGERLVSPFDLMTDAVLSAFAPYGITRRSDMVVTQAYRDAHPGPNLGDTANGFDPAEYLNFPPRFAQEPQGRLFTAGSSTYLSVQVLSTVGPFSYQWNRDGAAIAGATGQVLFLQDLQPADAGFYSVTATTPGGSSESEVAVITLDTGGSSRLVNLSCRARAGAGASGLIAGFVVGGGAGAAPLPLLIRGSGPALAAFGVPLPLADPSLSLFRTGTGGGFLASNPGWKGDAGVAALSLSLGAFAWTDPSSHDVALVESLPAGSYTANLSGAAGDAGAVLAEVYDATAPGQRDPSGPRLLNLSARALVDASGNDLIAGFVVAGDAPRTVLVRASGPALAAFGVAGPQPAPRLSLYGTGARTVLLSSNAGWGADPGIAAAAAAVGAFPWGPSPTADAALLVTLPPGSYTANVTAGGAGAPGIALVEVYEVPGAP